LLDESTNPELSFNNLAALQQSCNPSFPTGAVEAYATNGSQDLSRYEFTWYNGRLPLSPSNKRPETIEKVENLPIGFYSVKVLDKVTGCITAGSYYVREFIPGPVIDVISTPNTNCDPAKADGTLSATADGNTTGYKFEWYAGESASGTTLFTDSRPSIGGRPSGYYTVKAINFNTQCESTYTVFLDEEIEIVPIPQPVLLVNNMNCAADNGAVTASVNGNTIDYTFNWYTGESATGIPVITNGDYEGLAAGIYSVTATDRYTGCTSEKAIIEVFDERVYPVFSVKTRNSSCKEDNGSATINIEPGIEIESITVESANIIRTGEKATELAAGEYIVTVTSSKGCSTSTPITIGLDVHVYNGFSPNADGFNDKWVIGCLEGFPNNSVKVFNRAGSMVYEAKGYNNNDIYFEGLGNRGIYIGNPKLPDGTYFYIIERNDGSKPMSGYIELIR
jgi:gliding motility-associated-like protein